VNRTIFFATISFLTGFGVIIVWYFGGEEVVDSRWVHDWLSIRTCGWCMADWSGLVR
jgi:hypothetical protein